MHWFSYDGQYFFSIHGIKIGSVGMKIFLFYFNGNKNYRVGTIL